MVHVDEHDNGAATVVDKEVVCEAVAVGFVQVIGDLDRRGEAEEGDVGYNEDKEGEGEGAEEVCEGGEERHRESKVINGIFVLEVGTK